MEENVSLLCVGGYERRFAQIKVTKELNQFNDKITFESNSWVFMRQRIDMRLCAIVSQTLLQRRCCLSSLTAVQQPKDRRESIP